MRKMQKKSKQREGILQVLSVKNFHPTADDIFEAMKRDFPNLGIATVYRNLDLLTGHGKIVKIDVPGDSAHYDGNVEEHYHIICTKCGTIEDVWIDLDLEEHINLKKAIPGYKITGYRIAFRGICKKCKSKNTK